MAQRAETPTPASYWVAAVGGALTLLLTGYLAYDAMRSKAPPHFSAVVVAGEIRREQDRAYVPVEVTNEGDQAAAQVLIETDAGSGGAAIQSVIGYLAGGETQRVVAVVPGDPGKEFRARVVGYQEP